MDYSLKHKSLKKARIYKRSAERKISGICPFTEAFLFEIKES
jgi:hypothetical protein